MSAAGLIPVGLAEDGTELFLAEPGRRESFLIELPRLRGADFERAAIFKARSLYPGDPEGASMTVIPFSARSYSVAAVDAVRMDGIDPSLPARRVFVSPFQVSISLPRSTVVHNVFLYGDYIESITRRGKLPVEHRVARRDPEDAGGADAFVAKLPPGEVVLWLFRSDDPPIPSGRPYRFVEDRVAEIRSRLSRATPRVPRRALRAAVAVAAVLDVVAFALFAEASKSEARRSVEALRPEYARHSAFATEIEAARKELPSLRAASLASSSSSASALEVLARLDMALPADVVFEKVDIAKGSFRIVARSKKPFAVADALVKVPGLGSIELENVIPAVDTGDERFSMHGGYSDVTE